MTDSLPPMLLWKVSCQGAVIGVSHQLHLRTPMAQWAQSWTHKLSFIKIASLRQNDSNSTINGRLKHSLGFSVRAGEDGWCNSCTFNVRQTLRNEWAVPPSLPLPDRPMTVKWGSQREAEAWPESSWISNVVTGLGGDPRRSDCRGFFRATLPPVSWEGTAVYI